MRLTLYGKSAKTLAKVLGILGAALLLYCVGWTLYGDASGLASDCRGEISSLLSSPATKEDEAGTLRIVGRSPQDTIRTSGRLCLVVAGVAKKTDNAEADAKRPRIEISLFLDDRLVPLASKPTAAAKAEPQLLTFEFSHSDSATSDPSKSWRSLLAGRAIDGTAAFRVGIARAPAIVPDAFGTPPLKILVYRVDILKYGVAAMVFLIAAFVIFAANSMVLRDNTQTMQYSNKFSTAKTAADNAKIAADTAKTAADTAKAKSDAADKATADAAKKASDAAAAVKDPASQAVADAAKADSEAAKTDSDTAKVASVEASRLYLELKQKSDKTAANLKWITDNPDQPVGSFSLGRTQMALWLGLTIAGFIFLWLTLGFYLDVITTSILVLLGINGTTGLAAVTIDKQAAAGSPPQTETRSFLGDLVCDSNGNAQLHRVQVAAWTCILAVIFVWNTIWNFVFVNFDTNLLLLMGIANALYLGFKPSEKP